MILKWWEILFLTFFDLKIVHEQEVVFFQTPNSKLQARSENDKIRAKNKKMKAQNQHLLGEVIFILKK